VRKSLWWEGSVKEVSSSQECKSEAAVMKVFIVQLTPRIIERAHFHENETFFDRLKT